MHALIIALAETEEKAPLFMPAWVFPLIAAVAFLFLAIVSWTYRDVANRHSDRVPHRDGSHGSDPHGSDSHGSDSHGSGTGH